VESSAPYIANAKRITSLAAANDSQSPSLFSKSNCRDQALEFELFGSADKPSSGYELAKDFIYGQHSAVLVSVPLL